jgi:hypothetical protein
VGDPGGGWVLCKRAPRTLCIHHGVYVLVAPLNRPGINPMGELGLSPNSRVSPRKRHPALANPPPTSAFPFPSPRRHVLNWIRSHKLAAVIDSINEEHGFKVMSPMTESEF